MQSEKLQGLVESKILKEKYPGYNYALYFLEAEGIIHRRIGYSLLAPIFKNLPRDLQEHICFMWQIETEKGKLNFKFVKCCNEIFSLE
ncbi:MAG: hypothetical protein H7641_07025 [Candidatus Heimdallarchaeota archaeon]|nr:hypothetical protein [Candidatus Heimdallarchaeota archaeon]MCK4877317.1 hypothetical protein [Candidatus Heimdallarchaeota archaeon]